MLAAENRSLLKAQLQSEAKLRRADADVARARVEAARAKEEATSAIAEGARLERQVASLATELREGEARAGEGAASLEARQVASLEEGAHNLAKAREEARNLSSHVEELEASAAAAADTGGVASYMI